MTTTGIDERRTNTREQIRTVALEMFAERGYDKTSLREIAERLGVTKAAVYYHFRTKEEIVSSLFEDQALAMDAILTWAREQPAGPDRRRGVLERYSAMLSDSPTSVNLVKFLQENQTAFRALDSGLRMRERMHDLSRLLVPGDAAVADQLRTRLALIALHIGAFATDELSGTAAQRHAAALTVALDLADCAPA